MEKVEQAAKDLGYVPQKRKTRKESKKKKLLVVFCSNLTNPYYVMLLQGIGVKGERTGLRTLCMQYAERSANGRTVPENDVGIKAAGDHLYL